MDVQLVIASANDAVAADYAAHVRRAKRWTTVLFAGPSVSRRTAKEIPIRTAEECGQTCSTITDSNLSAAAIFLGRRWGVLEQAVLDAVTAAVRAGRRPRVCIVGTFQVHFGDRRAERLETGAVSQFESAGAEVSVVRR